MALSPQLSEFLGPRAFLAIAGISDNELRARVVESLEACAKALQVVDDLDLSRYELADLGTPDVELWNSAAPAVRDVLNVMQETSRTLGRHFPPDTGIADELDDEIDLSVLDEDSIPEPIRDRRAVEMDGVVEGMSASPHTQLGHAISNLVTMLHNEFLTFGSRLRSARIVSDRWFFLGELQEFRAKCTKCLEAITATILNAYGSAVSLSELLPRYGTEAERAAALRAAVVDLSLQITTFQQALSVATIADVPMLRSSLSTMLANFSRTSHYTYLRAVDKRSVIVLRLELDQTPDDALDALSELVSGFQAFLELMRGINSRPELAEGDRQNLEAARMLLESGHDEKVVLTHARRAYGRLRRLDAWLRAHSVGDSPPLDDLKKLLDSAIDSATAGV